MDKFETLFLVYRKADLQRIARHTKGELTAEDVQGEAWLLAREIGDRRGREFDCADVQDQELLLGALYNALVKRADWHLKNAVRIDQTEDEDRPSWAHQLPARPSSDPLMQLQMAERAAMLERVIEDSFSQLKAYVILYARWNHDFAKISDYLAICRGTLRRRFKRAEETVLRQRSLFDRKKKIGVRFKPLPGVRYLRRAAPDEDVRQSSFAFASAELVPLAACPRSCSG